MKNKGHFYKAFRPALYRVMIMLLILIFCNKSFAQQDKVLVSIANELGTDATLFCMNPDGSGMQHLFDFHTLPFINWGNIWTPRIAPDGQTLYFSSDNAYQYTPAERNIFQIAYDGSWVEQITPGPNSGQIPKAGGTGIVTGRVSDSYGTPYSGGLVMIEGVEATHTDANGEFRFDQVPEGLRYITAYRPGTSIFDSREVMVIRNIVTQVDLVPDSDFRISFKSPIFYQNRIYFILGLNSIFWTDLGGTTRNEIFTGTSDIDGFDVSPITGRLAIVDYATGTYTNQGIYVADQNGNNLSLFINLKIDFNWNGAQEIFWSPDESKLAFKGSYNWLTYFIIVNANNGNVLGSVYFDQSYTIYNIQLCGWSPDGQWLLFSQWLNSVQNTSLSKIKVNSDGSFDINSVEKLLDNENISAATWGRLQKFSGICKKAKTDQLMNCQLYQNYPNPFNHSTRIQYYIPQSEYVSLVVYDILGRVLIKLVDGYQMAGSHEVTLEIKDLTSGLYFCCLRTASFSKVIKMTLLE